MGDMHNLLLLTSVKYNVLESANVYSWVVAAGSLKTFVTFYQTALRQIPEDNRLLHWATLHIMDSVNAAPYLKLIVSCY